MSNFFVACYEPGPAWIKGKPLVEQPLESHLEYLFREYEKGHVVIGGPYDDGSGGVVVFQAKDIVDVNGIVARDPAVRQSILQATVRKLFRMV